MSLSGCSEAFCIWEKNFCSKTKLSLSNDNNNNQTGSNEICQQQRQQERQQYNTEYRNQH